MIWSGEHKDFDATAYSPGVAVTCWWCGARAGLRDHSDLCPSKPLLNTPDGAPSEGAE